MRYGNCIIYAVPKCIRQGGYLRFCWSPRNRYIPHCAWIRPDNVCEEFIPENPKESFWGVFFAIIFKGKVVITDESIKEPSIKKELCS